MLSEVLKVSPATYFRFQYRAGVADQRLIRIRYYEAIPSPATHVILIQWMAGESVYTR